MLQFSRNSILIGDFEIRYYGIMILLGVILAMITASRREKRYKLKKDTTVDLAIICVPVGVICARIYYCAFEWDYYGKNLLKIFDIRGGGLAIYGGLIGAFIAGFIYSKIKKYKYLTLCDLVAPGIALAQALGRWGNFFNQEAYGIPITNATLQFFPIGVFIDATGSWHCATFFYESVWCLFVCILLLILEKKEYFKRRGEVFFTYAFLYACERCVIEGMRMDSLLTGSIRISLLVSIIVMCAIPLIMFIRKSSKIPLAAFPALALLICEFFGLSGDILRLILAFIALILYFCARRTTT